MVEEEVARILGEDKPTVFRKVLAAAPDISGGYKKRLRKQGGKLVVIKKRKKKLPLHLRKIKPSQAKRIARKSAIKRKGKQARISKKAAKTTKKGRSRGLYKIK